MSLTSEADGPPMKAGVGIADVLTGMYAAVGILAAVAARLHKVLVPLLSAPTAGRTAADWLVVCAAGKIPAGSVNDLAQVFSSSRVAARGMRVRMDHAGGAGGGTVDLIGNPLHLSRTPVSFAKAPPKLGEDTMSVLARETGLGAGTLHDPAAAGVIEGRPDP